MKATREDALSIWKAAVAAANPFALVRDAVGELRSTTGRILVVGGGKAGAAMAAGAEAGLADVLDRVDGLLNVPEEPVEQASSPVRGSSTGQEACATGKILLHPARPAGSNHPTQVGVYGAMLQLALAQSALPGDVGLCLLSGGGSALLPAPAEGVSLEDKQLTTKLLHACGATIGEMNCVRKHLSRYKGGRLAQAFADRGVPVLALIISDVVGDPLDVIASGPTSPDPTTFEDALEVLRRYGLMEKAPAGVIAHLQRGGDETPKSLPSGVRNVILGNNARSLRAAEAEARRLGYPVLNLGSFIEGETRHVATVHAGIVRSVRTDRVPTQPPLCLLSGGETTVTLGEGHGKGGRNQEFVLALLDKLGEEMAGVVVLSGGTDGEDGPTDAAGAVADETTAREGIASYLMRHDAYTFFERAGGLIRTGLTHTNVMDVRVILVGG
jgi:hydroxypyruvate reductase/glycerate 2-kinase